jgi:hypothetical protein
VLGLRRGFIMGEFVPEYIVKLGTWENKFCWMGEFRLLLGLVLKGDVCRGLLPKLRLGSYAW